MSNRILRRFDVKLVRSSKRTHHDEIWRPLSDLIEPAPGGPSKPFSAPFLKGLQGSQIASLQNPADFAVVMPTVLQPTITDAIRSVFNQRFDGTIQLLIGIDTGSRSACSPILYRAYSRRSIVSGRNSATCST